MGTYGDELWNVTQLTSTQLGRLILPVPAPTLATDARAFLQAVLNAARSLGGPGGDAPGPGAIVYLPPRVGDYVLRPVDRPSRDFIPAVGGADLLVHPNVTLWFAPGAVLVLQPNVILRIDGAIRTDARQIFRGIGTHSAIQRRGQVVFKSTKILEVYPEWWGALSTPDDQALSMPTDDTEALLDCLKAAHTDRTFPDGFLPTLPIVLRGNYQIARELEVKPIGPPFGPPLDATQRTLFSGVPNATGLVLYGRRGPVTANQGRPALEVGATFRTPPTPARALTGNALLRLEGLHGSIVEGVGFNAHGRADICVQITGSNARSSVFRGCSFINARRVNFLAGDPPLEDMAEDLPGEPALPLVSVGPSRFVRVASRRINSGWDLSGLLLEDCVIENDESGDGVRGDARYELVGILFHANQTLPMTLDRCLFKGSMAANVEARGGALVVRGCAGHNQLPRRPFVPSDGVVGMDRPRGGVDFFLGDVLLFTSPDPMGGPRIPSPQSITGLTVIQFESQSDQFLDTFRHPSASRNVVAFLPTVLEGVSQRFTRLGVAAPPSVIWAGPGIRIPPTTGEPWGPVATLTLIGCVFGGIRGRSPDTMVPGEGEPSGVVVVDSRAFLVGDVDTRATNPVSQVFVTYDSMQTSPARRHQNAISAGGMPPVWLRKM